MDGCWQRLLLLLRITSMPAADDIPDNLAWFAYVLPATRKEFNNNPRADLYCALLLERVVLPLHALCFSLD